MKNQELGITIKAVEQITENHNRVELIGSYGGDKTHAMSAWTSTDRTLTEDKEKRIGSLLKYLASEGHHTPFEKSSIHFLVETEIATHVQLLKHRIGVSINAESARYKELKEDKFYVPLDWPEHLKQKLKNHCEESIRLYHETLEELERGFYGLSLNGLVLEPTEEYKKEARQKARKRAKESARFFLPYANKIRSDIMFNFRSFMHFLELRLEQHAQLEITQLSSNMIIQLLQSTNDFDLSFKAFEGTIFEIGFVDKIRNRLEEIANESKESKEESKEGKY